MFISVLFNIVCPYLLIINIQYIILNLNLIPGDPNDSLYKIFLLIPGPFKNNGIPPLRAPYSKNIVIGKWHLDTVNEFIHQDMVTDEQCGLH